MSRFRKAQINKLVSQYTPILNENDSDSVRRILAAAADDDSDDDSIK